MKRIYFLWFFMLFIISPPIAHSEGRFEKGTLELGVGSNPTSRSLEPFVGYFFYDHFEGVLHFGYSHMNDDLPLGFSDAEVDSVFISGRFLYNLPTGTIFVPTLGLGLAYANTRVDFNGSPSNNIDEEVTSFNGNVGFRFLIGKNASFNGDLTFFTSNFNDNLSTFSLDRSGINFGFSFSLFL